MTLFGRRFHYAWVILVAACVLGIVARADSASFAVFVDPLVERFAWKRGDISFAYALAFLVGLPAVVVMIGAFSFSAMATAALPASSAPPPRMISGLFAPLSLATAAAT